MAGTLSWIIAVGAVATAPELYNARHFSGIPDPFMHYDHISEPADGERITVNGDHSINVPDAPIIPYIEGDGIGIDVTPVMQAVTDAAVRRAYGGKRTIH